MILDEQFCQPFDENRRGLNLEKAPVMWYWFQKKLQQH